MSDKIDELLAERGKAHGDYETQAEIAIDLKNAVRSRVGYQQRLSAVQQDALEMIMVKVSRILNGDPNHRDHWDDIAGYARLAAERCPSITQQLAKHQVQMAQIASYGATNDQGEVWDGTGWVDPDFLKPRKAAE
jgi:Holliday junction resolvasome RuvABC ATP-dependent DNA helicase subunit